MGPDSKKKVITSSTPPWDRKSDTHSRKPNPRTFISDILKIIFYYSFTFHELTWNWLCGLQKAEFSTPLLQYAQWQNDREAETSSSLKTPKRVPTKKFTQISSFWKLFKMWILSYCLCHCQKFKQNNSYWISKDTGNRSLGIRLSLFFRHRRSQTAGYIWENKNSGSTARMFFFFFK